ncbi:transporter substrate-binding domain-containing protein [Desulfococcaceae bacterium HSG8]|nr:transporter substrate-binding domain-containing protein [Desulfococcaceae bacterium HSG8]
MKKPLLCLLSCWISLLVLYPPAFCQEKAVLLNIHDFPPLCGYSEKGLPEGIGVQVVKCVFEKMKQPYKIELRSLAKAALNVRTGNADGFFVASRNKDRDEFAVWSEYIAEQNWNWYLLKDNPFDPNDPSFKKQAKIASLLGTNSLKWAKENGYQVTGAPPTPDLLIRMLKAKRMDAIFLSDLLMQATMKQMDLTDEFRVVAGTHKKVGVYFSKKFLENHPGFLERFNGFVPGCRK